MRIPKQSDMPHKLALYKLLKALLSNAFIATNIYFKGGTCAAMLGYLDRFSVDLDFDVLDKSKKPALRKEIHKIIQSIGYEIKDESQKHLQFFLKYRDTEHERNTLKLEIADLVSKDNKYKKFYLIEIDKYVQAQTIETMFGNKLVAMMARYEEGKSIAGRDLYDIYYFFHQGYDINKGVVEDLRKTSYPQYIGQLVNFIEKHVSDKLLMQDLNPLMSKEQLHKNVPEIKEAVLISLRSLL